MALKRTHCLGDICFEVKNDHKVIPMSLTLRYQNYFCLRPTMLRKKSMPRI